MLPVISSSSSSLSSSSHSSSSLSDPLHGVHNVVIKWNGPYVSPQMSYFTCCVQWSEYSLSKATLVAHITHPHSYNTTCMCIVCIIFVYSSRNRHRCTLKYLLYWRPSSRPNWPSSKSPSSTSSLSPSTPYSLYMCVLSYQTVIISYYGHYLHASPLHHCTCPFLSHHHYHHT